jgi:hypothetical protein
MQDQSNMVSGCSSKVSSEPRNISLNLSKKRVKFQGNPQAVIRIPSFEGVWHSQASLNQMRDAALDTAFQSRYDPRYLLWNTLFQDPASDNLLCLWTTNSKTLRGLEIFVCSAVRRQKILEHNERVLAILQVQRRHYQKRRHRQRKERLGIEEDRHKTVFNSIEFEAEELAATSRQYSHSSIEMAIAMGKADAFAVTADDHNSVWMALIRDQLKSTPTGSQHLSLAVLLTDKAKNINPSSSKSAAA